MKVNGIEMLFSRFSDKDCMKISIKCLKKYLSLIQSGYSNFVLTEGFKTPLFFFLIQNVLLCQIYSFCCPKIFFISCRTSSTCIERNFLTGSRREKAVCPTMLSSESGVSVKYPPSGPQFSVEQQTMTLS